MIHYITETLNLGIRVIPEFDSPAHVGFGWYQMNGWDRFTVCVDHQPWEDYCVEPPCGQVINLINSLTIRIILIIFSIKFLESTLIRFIPYNSIVESIFGWHVQRTKRSVWWIFGYIQRRFISRWWRWGKNRNVRDQISFENCRFWFTFDFNILNQNSLIARLTKHVGQKARL